MRVGRWTSVCPLAFVSESLYRCIALQSEEEMSNVDQPSVQIRTAARRANRDGDDEQGSDESASGRSGDDFRRAERVLARVGDVHCAGRQLCTPAARSAQKPSSLACSL